MNYKRQVIETMTKRPETDDEYFSRCMNECAQEMEKAYYQINCSHFNEDSCGCESCKFYAKNNVERMKATGLKGEQCQIRLTINQVYGLRNRVTTGKD